MAQPVPPAAILSAVGFVVCVSISMILLIGDEHAISHHNHNSNGALGTIRRRLSEIDPFVERSELPVWAQQNLVHVSERPNPAETALFWHIPKSGGTTVKRLYECMGQTLANRLGADPRFGHDQDNEIVVFHPFTTDPDIKFVNVDTTSKSGILRAEQLGLVASKKVDIIFTSDISFASEHLFDPENKGRIYALFRHPVDRAVSKFYYLQTATWERTYRPEWAGMDIIEWATEENADENFIVKKLMGKKLSETVDMSDLIIAKEIIRQHFVVGLMNDMEESVRRFNIVLGVDYAGGRGQQCMEQYVSTGRRRLQEGESVNTNGANLPNDNRNSNPHPKVVEGSPQYNVLAERNALDMILYNYITLLYEEQKMLIDSFALQQ